jgi:hypothetical protein
MTKKLTDREQAERDYYKILPRFLRAKQPSTKERLEHELEAARQRELPTTRQNLKNALTLSPSAKALYLRGAKHGILPALAKGNVEPFFRAVELLPELFMDKTISEQTIVLWMENKLWKNERGNTARKNLTRLAKILTTFHGPPEYETEEEREEAKKASQRQASKRQYDKKRKGGFS